ncbi:MAG: RNA methyltransferase [Deltaproteobacteria bacterium]|nr:RNA methyltransferase [Deltaproteobacteria bacterium]
MTQTVNLDHITIVLVRPHIPENIGAALRAMNNMGLSRLVLVDPKNHDPSRVLKTATGSSTALLDRMTVHGDLKEALAPYHYIVGTTARTGSSRPAMTNPRTLARDLIPLARENRVAILFGPEDRGLSNDQLRYCHTITTIPTAPFSSLNLAQAVLILSYELFLAQRDDAPGSVPRLADGFELEGMYDHIKAVATKIGFIDPQNPEHWMRNIRRFLSRYRLRARETRIIRGFCRQIDWYTNQLEKREKKPDC